MLPTHLRGPIAALLLLAIAQPLAAQETRNAGEDRAAEAKGGSSVSLPPTVTRDQKISIGGKDLAYRSTTGMLTLRNSEGKPRADLGFFAYTREDEGKTRPVTFAFNGGPGAASAFLNLGAVGPRVVQFGEGSNLRPSAALPLMDNPDTWLDFTDLVFLDPVGTGWSTAADGVEERNFWSVEADARSLAEAIRLYLTQNDRRDAPVFLLGESYGGFRVPLVANLLRKDKGIGVTGLIMVSPVLDFAGMSDNAASPVRWMARIPSLAALKAGASGPVSRSALADAETYAAGDYLVDLFRGPKDKAAVARMADRLAALTGLDRAELEASGGRIELDDVIADIRKRTGKVPSLYDADILGLDPEPGSRRSRADDPVLDTITPMLETAMTTHARDGLGYSTDIQYDVLNGEVNRRWDFDSGRDAPEVVSDLQQVLSIDPKVRVLVVHGYADLVTPYFATKLVLDQLPAIGSPDRVRFEVFPGGHMFYSRADSRAAFTAAAKSTYGAAIGE